MSSESAPTVTIRAAVRGDLEGIVELDALRAGERKPGYWRAILDAYAKEGAAERVALVATGEDDLILGFLFGEVRAWEFGSERCGWIFSVAVRPGHERRTIASGLCEEAIRRFATMGIALVRTMVRRNDVPVLAFFRSMGFTSGPFAEMERPARLDEDLDARSRP